MVIDTTSDPSHSEPSPRCTNCTDRGAPCGGAASPACLSLVTNEVPSNATTRMTQGYRHSVQFSPTEDCIPETTYHDIDWGLHPRLDPTYDKPSNRTHRQRQILSLIKSNRELIEYEEDFDGIVYDDNPYDLPAATKQEDPNDLVSKIRFYGPDHLQTHLRTLCHEYIDIFSEFVRPTAALVEPLKLTVEPTLWHLPKNRAPVRPQTNSKNEEITSQYPPNARTSRRETTQILRHDGPDSRLSSNTGTPRLDDLHRLHVFPGTVHVDTRTNGTEGRRLLLPASNGDIGPPRTRLFHLRTLHRRRACLWQDTRGIFRPPSTRVRRLSTIPNHTQPKKVQVRH